MAFIDVRLPEQMELNAVRREKAEHTVVRTLGGHEVINSRQQWDAYTYDISFSPGEYDDSVITAAYNIAKASRLGLHHFRFKDFDSKNNTLSMEQIGVGNGAQTAFQITKTWTQGVESQVRNITRPVDPVSVYLDTVLQVSGYTVNYSNGIITFSVAPAAAVVVAVSGTYDIPVRFDLAYETTGLTHLLEDVGTLTLVEVKE